MKRILCSTAFAALASLASATTITVGPTGDFADISAAIQSLDALGRDGTPDVINVITDTLDNHPAILLNGTGAAVGSFPVLTDDITIDGNGDANANNCRLALGANIGVATDVAVGTTRWAVELAASQNVTIRNFTIVPHSLGAGGGSITANAITVDEGGAATILSGAQFNLNNVVFTSSQDATNTPSDTTVASTGTPTFFAGDTSSLAAYLSLQSQVTGANTFTHTINNCVFAHGRRDQMFIGCDGTATGAGVVNITNSRFSRTIFGALGDGLFISTAANTTINVTDTQFNNNDEHGINIAGSDANAANVQTLNINEGCVFNNNSFRAIGMAITSTSAMPGRINIIGTAAKPVQIVSNGSRGVRLDGSTPSKNQIGTVAYTHFLNNSVWGFEFNEADMAYPTTAGPLFSNCIFYRNGSAVTPNGQLDVQDTNATAGGLRVDECTFHDPGVTAGAASFNILTNSTAVTNFTWDIKNSIFSGTSTNDAAIRNNSGAGLVYNISNSAIVTAGTHALAAVPIVQTTAATINQSAVINTDPLYVEASNTASASFLDVNNGRPAGHPDGGGYITGAVGSTPLSGGADFVGGVVPVTMSGFTID